MLPFEHSRAHMRHMGRSFGTIKKVFLLSASLAPIAQLVEQLPLKEMVRGSNPRGRTKDTTTCPAAGFVLLSEAQLYFAFAK